MKNELAVEKAHIACSANIIILICFVKLNVTRMFINSFTANLMLDASFVCFLVAFRLLYKITKEKLLQFEQHKKEVFCRFCSHCFLNTRRQNQHFALLFFLLFSAEGHTFFNFSLAAFFYSLFITLLCWASGKRWKARCGESEICKINFSLHIVGNFEQCDDNRHNP